MCAISLEQMLREQGHKTAVFAMQYAENFLTPYSNYFAPEVSFSGGIGSKLRAASRIFGGAGVKAAFARLLKDFRPDVVHFNNIHSYLSPVIVKMAKDFGAKTVWTLHDYKLVCPSYSCLSQGKVCEECIGGNVHRVVDKRCMKGSRVASQLAYWEARYWSREKLEVLSENLHLAIKGSLRRGDSFTKYSPSQFLILLVGTNQENCDLIFRRILDKFSSKHKSWKQNLEYYVSSVADVENDNSRLHFHRNEFHWN